MDAYDSTLYAEIVEAMEEEPLLTNTDNPLKNNKISSSWKQWRQKTQILCGTRARARYSASLLIFPSMLKSFFLLLILLLAQFIAAICHLLFPSISLGTWFFVGVSTSLTTLYFFPLSEPLRLSAVRGKDAGLIVGMLLVGTGLSLLLTPFNLESELALAQFRQIADSYLGLATLCFMGPLLEEIVFRGGIQQHLKRTGLSRWWAILITSLAFALVHGNVMQALPAMLLGVVLGWLYEKRGYHVAVMAHVANNIIGVIGLKYEKTFEFIESFPTSYLLLLGAALTALGLWGVYQLIQKS